MATKKKKKAKKASRPAKAKKTPAKKSKTKKAAKRPTKKAKKSAKKTVKTAARKAPAKKAKAIKKKAPARKKKQVVGEGDYAASKSFLKDQASFVEKNKAKIPAMGQEAEKALDGPEGDALREAEATALARSRDSF
jgi:hypothetical protein